MYEFRDGVLAQRRMHYPEFVRGAAGVNTSVDEWYRWVDAWAHGRFLPPAGAGTTLLEHTVTQGDRLDNLTARYLGDPTAFWRVCDANGALRPDELVEEIGRRIRIALPDGTEA